MLSDLLPHYISFNSCAMIGQFSWPSFTVRLTKFESFFRIKILLLCLNPEITNILAFSFLVCAVSYKTLFFPFRFLGYTLCVWATNPTGKKLVCNLQYNLQLS